MRQRIGFCTYLLIFFHTILTVQADEQNPPTILFLGDSLTAGFGLETDLAYPALVEAKIMEAGLSATVVNAGLSGETSAGGLRRVNWLLRREIDVLFLALGANDALRGLDPAQTTENLRAICTRVRARYPETQLILAGMLAPPNLGEAYGAVFAATYPTVAQEFDAALIPFLLEGVAGDPALNLPDGIHPNAEGQERVAAHVWPTIKTVLEKTQTAKRPADEG